MTIQPPNDVVIRPATEADAQAISLLVTTLSRKFITPDYSTEGARALLNHQTAEAIKSVIDGGTTYWVAEGADGLLGVVALIKGSASVTHLYHLFVAESHHRQGLGRRLWEHALRQFAPAGGPEEFTVNSSRFAVPFYRSLGFVSSGRETSRDGVICQPMRLGQREGVRSD